MPNPSIPRTARDRARAEVTSEIVEAARRHLGVHGAAGLSLRAVTRELGMASSAIYRYFPSRDDLLTRLIIDAYNDLGETVEQAEAAVARSDLLGRWMAVAMTTRAWGLAHPEEWTLIYGSPVPGYAAPDDTIAPATRVAAVLLRQLADGYHSGRAPEPQPVPRPVRSAIKPLREFSGDGAPDDLLVRGLMAMTQLIGAVMLEINGQFKNTIDDLEAYFELTMRRSFVF